MQAPFEIQFRRPYDARVYRATVELIFQTDKLMRFRLKGGDKEMELEKHLYRKNNQWKVGRFNFNPTFGIDSHEKMLQSIFDAIDQQLK